jgi:hypothetical protein
MSADRKEQDELVTAAQAFEEGLTRFARACDGATRRSLDSRRGLELAAEALKEAATAEEELGPRARALAAAIQAARDRQERQAEALRARAQEIEQRSQLYDGLMRRYRALGEEATSLTGLAQRFAETKRSDAPPDLAELRTGLAEFDGRMGKAADEAQSLSDSARASLFEEVAKDAHALYQKLTSMRNKVKLLREALGLLN